MAWIKSNWYLILALAAAASAWGAQQVRVQSLEEVVKSQALINQQLQDKTGRIDERTQLIMDSQKRQETLLQHLMERAQRK